MYLSILLDYREQLEAVLDNLDRIELAEAHTWMGWVACIVDKDLNVTLNEFTQLVTEVRDLIAAADQ